MKLEHLQPNILHRRLLVAEASRRLLNQTDNPDDSYDSDDSEFDTNMLITLSVLLCALILLLGLNAFVRWGLRRSSSPEQPATPGLKKRALRQLPAAVYGSAAPDINSSKECPICLGEFVEGQRIRVLPKCRHGFHVGCIDKWLISNASCPNCRLSLLQPRTPPSTDGAAGPDQQPPFSILTQQ